MSGICYLTIRVNYLSCFIIFYKLPSMLLYYMLCSVFDVQIIWDATATTWDGYFLIHYILFGYVPSWALSYPTAISFRTASYIYLYKSFNHFSTFPFAITAVFNFILSLSGERIPSIMLLYVVGLPSAIDSLTNASKHFPRCC